MHGLVDKLTGAELCVWRPGKDVVVNALCYRCTRVFNTRGLTLVKFEHKEDKNRRKYKQEKGALPSKADNGKTFSRERRVLIKKAVVPTP